MTVVATSKRQSFIPIDFRAWKGAAVLFVLSLAASIFSMKWAFVGIVFLCLHLAFFRDPKRSAPGFAPVSPADGKIVDISSVFEERFLKEEAVKVGIFLSIFNAHVTRTPIGGSVEHLQYVPGKFLNALRKDSVIHNECNWIGVREGNNRVLIRQIAGGIARRIYWDVELQDRIDRGDKIGIICYGSRVECYLPKRLFRPGVKVGDTVKAGQTILGEWQ